MIGVASSIVISLLVVIALAMYYSVKTINEIEPKATLTKTWQYLSDSASICTVGGEYCSSKKCGGEGCEIHRWTDCLKHFDPKQVTSFLIRQIQDTSKSAMHVCPNQMALKGEAAIYCLQTYTLSNWYDLDSATYHPLLNKMYFYGQDTFYIPIQRSLQNLINESEGSDKLVNLWVKEVNKRVL
jgi:hypothetical protein